MAGEEAFSSVPALWTHIPQGASQSTAAERRLNVPLLESLGSGVLCDANGLADVFRDVHI